MLKFILGRSGFGKTRYIYDNFAERVNRGEGSLMMIVPDQNTFETEKAFLDMLGAKRARSVSVFGFSRLCSYIFERAGICGAEKVIDDPSRAVLMSMAMEQTDDSLEMYRGCYEKSGVIDAMLSTLKECKSNKISTAAMRTAAESIDNGTLRQKLIETALILDAFEAIVSQSGIDPLDNLSRACGVLGESALFEGWTAAVDDFDSFTAQQAEMLRLLFSRCKEVCVTLSCDPSARGGELFSVSENTLRLLTRLAESDGVEIGEPELLTENHRSESDELKFLERNMYRSDGGVFDGVNESVTLFRASDIYSECEFVAAKIKELVIERGYLYSDISVICRDITPYEGVLDTVLERYGIPRFMDMRFDIYIKPAIRYVCSIFNIILNGCRKEDVISLLKTGLTENSEQEISAFENYVYVWNINSASFKKEFKNNPRGYAEGFSEREAEELAAAERVRLSVIAPLEKFKRDIKDKTAAEITELLYNLLIDLNVTDRISDLCDELEAAGESAASAEQMRIWELLTDTLDKTVLMAGELKISPKRYFRLLTTQLSRIEIADIPRTLDSVTVATAKRARLSGKKAAFLIGCADGIFPAAVRVGGAFSQYELKILALNDLPFKDDPAVISNFETFIAYKSAVSPSNLLFVSYYASDLQGGTYLPSSIIKEISRIFPETPMYDEVDFRTPENSVWSLASAFEECAAKVGEDSPQARALRKYFSENEKYSSKYSALIRAAKAKPFVFEDSGVCEELFGGELKISASQIEKFSLCRFSYFCNYGLRVRERRKAELDPLEYGTFVHYIMERFFSRVGKGGIEALSDDGIISLSDKIFDEYVSERFAGEQRATPAELYRFEKIKENLRILLLHIIEELKSGDFTIADCELKIGGDIPAYKLRLPTGQTITVRGSVDRVDIMRKGSVSYIRIIDYKTGGKQFRLSDILYGLNLQMLIYMYAITSGGVKRYGEVTPAGVLYMPAKAPIISADGKAGDEDIKKELQKGLRMNGIILDVPEVLNSESTRYISYNAKKGTLSVGGSLADLEEFGMIFSKIDSVIENMGAALYSGDVKASPTKGAHDACEYCPYDSVCAYNMSSPRKTFAVDNAEVCRLLKEETHGEN